LSGNNAFQLNEPTLARNKMPKVSAISCFDKNGSVDSDFLNLWFVLM
jgi:hypothetical protein